MNFVSEMHLLFDPLKKRGGCKDEISGSSLSQRHDKSN